jgi:hypothetical protein
MEKGLVFPLFFLGKTSGKTKGFSFVSFQQETLKRKHKRKQRVLQRNLCVFPPLIKDIEFFQQSFLGVFPAGKTQRKNPLFCHWSFHSFSLEKLNAFCSVQTSG